MSEKKPSKMTTWNDFPIEIKTMIINEIDLDGYDLLDLRLANKECNELSKKLFAQTYFTVRRHYVNKKSLEALVKISEDNFFAPFIRTIQLSALQGDYDVPSWGSDREPVERHPGVVNYHITFCKYEDRTELKSLLKQAFLNLKAYRTPFTIGIDRYWREMDGVSEMGLYGWVVPMHCNLDELTIENAKWANVIENERIAFNMITSVAEEVKLPVKGLKVSLYDHYMLLIEEGKEEWLDYNRHEPPKEPCHPDLVRDISDYLAKSPRMDVDIYLTTGDDRDQDWRRGDYPYQSMKVNYDRQSKTLTIDKTDTRDLEDFMRPWLSSIQLRSLRLTNMYITEGEHMEKLVKNHRSTLKRLRMTDCILQNDWVWRRAVYSIATISALEYLSFTNPAVKYNWKEFFNFYFGKEKKLYYKDDVQQHLLYDLECFEESEDQVQEDEFEQESEEEESEEEDEDQEEQDAGED